MKRLCAVAAVVLLLVASVDLLYAGQYGPVEPTAAVGKVSLGAGYFYSEQGFKSGNFNFGGASLYFDSFKLQSNQVYGQLSYGLTKECEAYIRVGAADATIRGESWGDTSKIYGTFGFRGVFYKQDWLSIGGFLQFNYYSTYKDSLQLSGVVSGSTVIVREEVKLKNPRDLSIGLAMQAKNNCFTVYGGPFAYWTKNQAEAQLSSSVAGVGSAGASDTVNLKDKTNVGGFFGVKVPLTKQLSFSAEGQFRDSFAQNSVGGILTYAF